MTALWVDTLLFIRCFLKKGHKTGESDEGVLSFFGMACKGAIH